jgi:predicted phosphodiesterase
VQSAGKLLPADLHRVLPENALGDGRVIIIGDVHGCMDELTDLLEEVGYTEENDTVILVGDLVDKGPYSLEVCPTARAANFIVCWCCL